MTVPPPRHGSASTAGARLLAALLFVLLSALAADAQAAWYDSNWTYRKQVTVDAAQVDATLANFPVQVDLNDLGAEFLTNAKADGGDIRVTKADGTTELPRQVILEGGAPSELHFKADSLSSSANTSFYIYYGNASASEPAAASAYGSESVWTNSYAGVWHLNEVSGTSISDSTSNANTGTKLTATEPNPAAGQIAGSQDFDGVNDSIDLGTKANLDVNYITIEFWMYADTWVSDGGILAKGDSASRQYWIWSFNNAVEFEIDQGGNQAAAWTPALGQWEHLALTYDGANVVTYTNGVQENSYPQATGVINAQTPSLKLGVIPGFNYSDAKLDEVRISDGARTATWVKTGYNNQNNPGVGGFLASIGSQETESCNTTPTVYSSAVSTTYNVPAGCDTLTVKAWGAGGAGGGHSGQGAAGGGGGFAKADISVTPGESLTIEVGGGGAGGTGGSGIGGGTTTPSEGGGTGGARGDAEAGGGGGGGGYAAVLRSSTYLVQAGGGGGGRGKPSQNGGAGGAGGGTSGGRGLSR